MLLQKTRSIGYESTFPFFIQNKPHFCPSTVTTVRRTPSRCDRRTLLIYSYTYLLTAWCRVLLEKLTGLQLVKKFLAFHGTRTFITAFTSVRHLSLSWVSPIQSIYPHPTSWRSILILSTQLRLGLPSETYITCLNIITKLLHFFLHSRN